MENNNCLMEIKKLGNGNLANSIQHEELAAR